MDAQTQKQLERLHARIDKTDDDVSELNRGHAVHGEKLGKLESAEKCLWSLKRRVDKHGIIVSVLIFIVSAFSVGMLAAIGKQVYERIAGGGP